MIHVATAFDDEMAAPSVALIRSLEARQHGSPTTMHIMHRSVSPEKMNLIKSEVLDYEMTVVFYEFDGLDIINYSNLFYPASIFIRFHLFELLILSAVDKVLYIDCDTIVRKNVSNLYESDLEGKVLGAVKDFSFYYLFGSIKFDGRSVDSLAYTKDILLMENVSTYFNSGVMLINLMLWAEKRIWTRVKTYLAAQPGLVLPDQDALNHIIDGAYKLLDARWNSLTFCKYLIGSFEVDENVEWRQVVRLWSEDPYLVHFAWISKPWEPCHLSSDYDAEYWSHLKDTLLFRTVVDAFSRKAQLLSGDNVLLSRKPGAISPFERRRARAISKRMPPEGRWPIPLFFIKLFGEFCFTVSGGLERFRPHSFVTRNVVVPFLIFLKTFGERCFYQIRRYG